MGGPITPRYWASGDTARFLELAPDMARIIDNAVDKFLQPNLNVAWLGAGAAAPTPTFQTYRYLEQ